MSTLKSSAEDLTLNADGSGNDIKFQSNGVEKASIDQDGNVVASGTISSTGDTTITNGDIVFATAGKGICLGVTSNTDANTLDDYEEGAHTVTFTAVTSGTVTLTGAQNALGYTKIGRLVAITGEINVASVSSPVGGIRMSLPFVIAANATDRDSNFGSPTLAYSVPFSAGHPPSVYGSSNTSYVSLLFMSDNGAFGNYTPAAGESFFFSFSYITTA